MVAEEHATDATTSSPSEDRSIPLLGIKHLLLFTTIAAAFFVLEKASHLWTRGAPSQTMAVAQRTSLLLYDIVTAAACTGLVTLLRNRDAKGRAFRASGHWVVLAHVSESISFQPVRFLQNLNLYIVAIIFNAIVLGFIAKANRGRWRWLFGIQSVVTLIGISFLLLPPLYSFSQLSGIILNLVVLGTLLRETISGKHRDWIHILGIAAISYSFVAMGFWQLVNLTGWFR